MTTQMSIDTMREQLERFEEAERQRQNEKESLIAKIKAAEEIEQFRSEVKQIASRAKELGVSFRGVAGYLQESFPEEKPLVKRPKPKSKTKDSNASKRASTGFSKPVPISKALCTFLGKPEGTEMARSEVTKFIITYITNNNLQYPADRRRIIPDEKLRKLLNPGNGETVTYFNLQTYLKVHYPKPSSPTNTKIDFVSLPADVAPKGWSGPFVGKSLLKYTCLGSKSGIGKFKTFEEAIVQAEKIRQNGVVVGGITRNSLGYGVRLSNKLFESEKTTQEVSWIFN